MKQVVVDRPLLVAAVPVVEAHAFASSLDDIADWVRRLADVGADVECLGVDIEAQRVVLGSLMDTDPSVVRAAAVFELSLWPFTWKLPKGTQPLGFVSGDGFFVDDSFGLPADAVSRVADRAADIAAATSMVSFGYRYRLGRWARSGLDRSYAGGRFGFWSNVAADARRQVVSSVDDRWQPLVPLSSRELWDRCFVADVSSADAQAARQIEPFLGKVAMFDQMVAWRVADGECVEIDAAEQPIVARVNGLFDGPEWFDGELRPEWSLGPVDASMFVVDVDGKRWDLSKLRDFTWFAPAVGSVDGFGAGECELVYPL